MNSCVCRLTEFLLIGLPQQLAKINISSLIITHSAREFDFIFDEHLTFSDQISDNMGPRRPGMIKMHFQVNTIPRLQTLSKFEMIKSL